MGSHNWHGIAKKVFCIKTWVRFSLTGLEEAVLEDFELQDGLASRDGGEV